MLKIFTGDDRVRAKKAIENYLGKEYEIIEGEGIEPNDLPNIFLGTSLFDSTRHILIRDFFLNKTVSEKLPDYLNTHYDIAFFESKLDKRSVAYKNIKDKIEVLEFSLPKNLQLNLVFDIFKTAKSNGKKAIAMLEKIKNDEDPMMFFGLLVSQAIKDYAKTQGKKEKRVLNELSKIDLTLKSTSYSPWLLIESILLRLSSL